MLRAVMMLVLVVVVVAWVMLLITVLKTNKRLLWYPHAESCDDGGFGGCGGGVGDVVGYSFENNQRLLWYLHA
jgi:hypothetical protein